jgi:hypothetical protein
MRSFEERAPVTPAMALRLSELCGNGANQEEMPNVVLIRKVVISSLERTSGHRLSILPHGNAAKAQERKMGY